MTSLLPMTSAETWSKILDCLEKNQQEVRNVKQYILATLYNASMTIDNYYQQMVQHDMANW